MMMMMRLVTVVSLVVLLGVLAVAQPAGFPQQVHYKRCQSFVSTTGRSVIDHVKVTRTTHPGQLRFSRETRLVAGDCNSGLAISLETVGYRVYFPQNATVAPNTYNVEYYLYGATHWLQNLRDAENDAANAVCLASGCCKPRRVMERINLSPCDVQQCNSTILYDVWQINNGSLATSLSGGSCTPFVTAASTTFAPAYIYAQFGGATSLVASFLVVALGLVVALF